MSVAPGDEPERIDLPLFENMLLSSGTPMKCWCLEHWLKAFGDVA
jgi:hypothetical protein